ncbi:thioesterase-like superfamily protein [Acinetobacter baumannii 44895_8]|nr:thioesterase-like superfamily protein [Acinetobacter baumannii 44895_8]
MSLLQLWEDVKQNEWIDIPAGWLQGRTVFGGLVAGVLMQKACSYIQDSNKRLLSCSVIFVGPVQQGAARLTIEVLREGKSVTTLEARLWQDDAVQTILVASFGASRASSIEVKQEPVSLLMYHLKIYLSFLLRNICLNAFSILKSVGLRGIIR